MSPELGEYLTTAEVAKVLRISPGTAQKMARQGKLTALKVGRLWRFPGHSITIRVYKQKQAAERSSAPTGEKTGWREFLKFSAEIGFVEPFERNRLYNRGNS